ncbi:hypothetical protein JW935_25390, partial [candidate division KSB1 bacterium]|nr:hypothetical protein [candidate division KSB1 bacterium]
MNRTLIYLLLTIFLLSCAGARRSTPPQTEIFSLPPVPSQSNVEARTDSITYFTRFFDRQNESQFKIPAGMTGELLRKKLQQTEITVQKLLSDRPDTLFLLAFDEWCFFALIGLQDLFKEEFNRPSHSYDADGGILFTFDKDVSGLLPYIQENRRICREKTQLVYNVLDVLDRPLNAEKQSRGLLALTRMLEKIDIKKSESGYEPFQRSAEGLYLTPGVLASRVENIFSRMSENQVLEKAKELKGNIQKQLSKPLDRAFVEKMQTSKEL